MGYCRYVVVLFLMPDIFNVHIGNAWPWLDFVLLSLSSLTLRPIEVSLIATECNCMWVGAKSIVCAMLLHVFHILDHITSFYVAIDFVLWNVTVYIMYFMWQYGTILNLSWKICQFTMWKRNDEGKRHRGCIPLALWHESHLQLFFHQDGLPL